MSQIQSVSDYVSATDLQLFESRNTLELNFEICPLASEKMSQEHVSQVFTAV